MEAKGIILGYGARKANSNFERKPNGQFKPRTSKPSSRVANTHEFDAEHDSADDSHHQGDITVGTHNVSFAEPAGLSVNLSTSTVDPTEQATTEETATKTSTSDSVFLDGLAQGHGDVDPGDIRVLLSQTNEETNSKPKADPVTEYQARLHRQFQARPGYSPDSYSDTPTTGHLQVNMSRLTAPNDLGYVDPGIDTEEEAQPDVYANQGDAVLAATRELIHDLQIWGDEDETSYEDDEDDPPAPALLARQPSTDSEDSDDDDDDDDSKAPAYGFARGFTYDDEEADNGEDFNANVADRREAHAVVEEPATIVDAGSMMNSDAMANYIRLNAYGSFRPARKAIAPSPATHNEDRRLYAAIPLYGSGAQVEQLSALTLLGQSKSTVEIEEITDAHEPSRHPSVPPAATSESHSEQTDSDQATTKPPPKATPPTTTVAEVIPEGDEVDTLVSFSDMNEALLKIAISSPETVEGILDRGSTPRFKSTSKPLTQTPTKTPDLIPRPTTPAEGAWHTVPPKGVTRRKPPPPPAPSPPTTRSGTQKKNNKPPASASKNKKPKNKKGSNHSSKDKHKKRGGGPCSPCTRLGGVIPSSSSDSGSSKGSGNSMRSQDSKSSQHFC